MTVCCERGYVSVGIENLNGAVGLYVGGRDFAGALCFDCEDFWVTCIGLEQNLLEVQDNHRYVFDHSGQRTEFVRGAFDGDGRKGRAFE